MKSKDMAVQLSSEIDCGVGTEENIFEEYFEITKEVDECIKEILEEIKKTEKQCFDKRILVCMAKLQCNYNNICGWRRKEDCDVERISEALVWWYENSLKQIKRLVSRLKKNQKYSDISEKIGKNDYLKRMKIILKSPRYAYIAID